MKSASSIISIGAIFCALAVILGAFGAHSLKELLLTNDKTEVYKTAVQYHIFHSLALILSGILYKIELIKNPTWPVILFIAGLFLFSGSLYVLSVSGYSALGIITPFGGLSFIAGWLIIAYKAWKN